jgi:hypothetical protein
MGVGVVLAGSVVMVLGGRRVRREFLEPDVVVVEQPVLGIVDEYRRVMCIVLIRARPS